MEYWLAPVGLVFAMFGTLPTWETAEGRAKSALYIGLGIVTELACIAMR